MRIAVIGLNHKVAPLDIRERLAFDARQSLQAIRMLKARFPEAEFVLLSTCNRVELYSACKRTEVLGLDTIAEFFSQFHSIPATDFRDFLYIHNDVDAVRHLLAVASSLDSMVVGEGQIIGQVKESYRLACTAKSTGKILNHLFHCAFSVSKKVHTSTSIATGRVSVAGVAVELAMQLFADISVAEVVVIGAGEMGELLVRHLLHVGCKNITVVNRSFQRGVDMARRHGIAAGKWEEIEEHLSNANIVIASAATQDYLFRKDSFKNIMNRRRKGALLIIDIAVPRNFEPSINEIEEVYLYSVDELSGVAEQNRRARKEDMAKARHIIHENTAKFMDWFRARDIGPLIGQLKEKFDQISRNELEQFFVGARQKAPCKEVLELMVNRLVNKLLHCVIKNVNVVAKKHGPTEAAKLVDSIVQQAEKISAEADNNSDAES